MRGWPKRSQTGKWSVLAHKFCSIFAEKEEVLHPADHDEEARKHGDIEVLVYRTKPYGEVHPSTYYGKGAPQIIGILSEEAMNGKILTHSVSSEDPVPISQPYARSVDFVDGRDHPIARFIFRYRSREALQKLQIMETPIDHVDKLSVEELRQRYRHFLSMNYSLLATSDDDQVRKIKYESDDSSDEAQTRRKRKR